MAPALGLVSIGIADGQKFDNSDDLVIGLVSDMAAYLGLTLRLAAVL
jgi:hypothetical protein